MRRWPAVDLAPFAPAQAEGANLPGGTATLLLPPPEGPTYMTANRVPRLAPAPDWPPWGTPGVKVIAPLGGCFLGLVRPLWSYQVHRAAAGKVGAASACAGGVHIPP